MNIFRHTFCSAFVIFLANFAWPSTSQAQTWTTNSPLNAPRWAHTSTLLTNGFVLITGGLIYNTNGNSYDTNSAELYNPTTGTSTVTDSMMDSRHSHTATLLPNGKVLVAGGGSPSSELYDPDSGTWDDDVDMQDERIVHTATLLNNGKVLVAAGYDDNHGVELDSAELYDPDTDQWTITGSLPYGTDSAAAALLNNGKVLVCGGSDGLGSSVTNAAIYDPTSGTWTSTAPLNEARAGHTATLLQNGKVLVEGGNGNNSVEVYDPVAGTWSYGAEMNDGRYQSVAVLLPDGTIMVLGGGNPDVEVYNPTNDQWDFVDPLPVPGFLQTATVLTNGDVLVTGGSETDFNGPPIYTVQRFGTGVVSSTPAVTVTASPSSGPVQLTVQFTSPDQDSDGNMITDWNWDFGDGATSTEQSPSHIYNSMGTFSPALTAFNSATQLTVFGPGTITVTGETLNASDNPSFGPFPLSVQFSSTNVDSGGNMVTNWLWNFGDGGTSTQQNPTHVYLAAGNFSPALTAYSASASSPLIVSGLSGITVIDPPTPAFKTLYTFTPDFGASPNGGLLLLGSTLYGTTEFGGSNNFGTAFKVNTDASGFTNLAIFSLSHGVRPNGSLIASGATLYGTLAIGGDNGGGVVFALNTNGTGFSQMFNFTFNVPSTGEEPSAGVVLSGDTLYGTTEFGGAFDHGTVFSVTTNGANISDLHSFTTPSGQDFNQNFDGLFPITKLILSAGTLYGTAEGGGNFGRGTVFALDINGSFRVLHHFTTPDSGTGTNADGASPFAGLVLAGNTLYGTAAFGGTSSNGTIFAINTDGTGFTNIYNFTGGNDGSSPHGGLVVSGNTLYGSTANGGPLTNGALFAIHTDGSGFTNLYNFTGGSDGAEPNGDLLLSGNVLYGTAGAGALGSGTVFAFALPSTLLTLSPPLAINPSGTNVILTWSTNAVGYGLQSSAQFGAAAAWNPVSPLPVIVNGKNTVTNALVGPRMFYRLGQ